MSGPNPLHRTTQPPEGVVREWQWRFRFFLAIYPLEYEHSGRADRPVQMSSWPKIRSLLVVEKNRWGWQQRWVQKWIGLAAYFQATTSATVRCIVIIAISRFSLENCLLRDNEAHPQIKLVIVDIGRLLVTFNYDCLMSRGHHWIWYYQALRGSCPFCCAEGGSSNPKTPQ